MSEKEENINQEAENTKKVKADKVEETKGTKTVSKKVKEETKKVKAVKETKAPKAKVVKEKKSEATKAEDKTEEPIVAEVKKKKATKAKVTEETKNPETVVEKVEETEVVEEPASKEKAEKSEKTKKSEKTEKTKKASKEVVEESEEFDWDSIGKKHEEYTETERTKLENIYDGTLSSIVEHEVVDGFVVAKNNREVVVNIGFKSDGIIPLNELRYNPDLKIGDKIEVYVESQEDLNGQLILSHKKARTLKSWERINIAYEKEEVINGYVKCRTKGGLIVDVFGIEAFLPGSQIDVKPIRDYDIYVDKSMEFKVVKINHEYKNVVVSHKALIEDELEHQKAEIISKLEKGQVLEGTVKNITSYGVFIDLGGVDGLIHITDLSWGRINHPEEIVELDQKLKIVILDFDDNKKRIALGLKQLTPHPWDALDTELKVTDNVKGKVVVIADYGAFIEIAPGVEGLIHVSEMSWSQHLRTAQDFLKVGDEIEAQILTLDREDRKMSLGMKQLIPDPWTNIQDRYPKHSKHSATVRNFTNFGIFVELEEGVDGLIHISDLSWSKKIKHPAEFTKIAEKIEVIVLEVDEENRRLSLGHKQLEENPWDVFETIFTMNSVHSATILTINEKGAVVSLPYGVEGFVPNRHLAKEDNTSARVDDTMDFKVIEFSKDSKKIILSHTRIYQDVQYAEKAKEHSKAKSYERSTKKAVKHMKDKMERTTLGDLDALANLKSEMLESEKKAKAKKKAKTKKEEE
ncbi:MAG: 30S ribosomal protein S1 [Bacteroidetes bacterium]|nr:30S ribosomal protein S1 [Bacteroidota bacterium]